MKFVYSLAVIVLIAFSGCGGNVKIGGKIVFDDNDEPLTFGTISFSDDQHQYRGNIHEDGSYTIGGLSDTDGLPPGTYRIAIDAVVFEGYDKRGNPIEEHVIHPKYRNPETSGLTVNVDGSSKHEDLKVSRP